MLSSIVITVFSEFSFTLYVDVYGFLNVAGHIPSSLSARLVSKSGIEIPIIYTASFIRDKDNNPTTILITMKDMTEIKRIEERLRQAKSMEMIGKLSLGAAHEVRNPLNSITAISEALFREIGENPEYKPYLDHIRDQVQRLSNVMKDLLDYGRPINQTDLHPAYIAKIIREAADSRESNALYKRYAVTVHKADEADTWRVKADAAKMQQVFVNLLENACNHSHNCRDIVITLSKKADEAVIQVTDKGSGIQPESIAHIFEPFFTTGRAAPARV